MDAEVEKAADKSTTTDDDQQSWRSWFGKGITQIPADGADDEDVDELDADDLDADDLDADDLDADGLVAAEEVEPARPRLLRWPTLFGEKPVSFPLTVRPLINPRLRADPRWRVWITRAVVSLLIFMGVSMWLNWRFGLTAAVIYACADTVYRSKTTSVTPTAVRVTSAQRSTARRLRVLRTAGYMALHARTIPGTDTVIDHVVVGPSGVFTVDSQRMDRRLPVRAIGGMLFHGPVPQAEKIDHARFEAERAAVLIANELGQRVRVRPAMVVYPSVPWIIMRLKGVDVFDGHHVGTYFRKQSKATADHRLDTAQIALVFAAAAHALPSIT
ncbi:MAG TPA: nuclease-related domain-containing protein [Streptosporangiaceae bacterium]|nr:nuclease-related domain-containing protein [Streptosporangiaceae bacterium]